MHRKKFLNIHFPLSREKLFIFFFFSPLFLTAQPIDIKKSDRIEFIDGQKYYLHKVEKGQTLFAIATTYQLPYNEIITDDISFKGGLKTGQILKIRCGERINSLAERRIPAEPEYASSLEEIKYSDAYFDDLDSALKIPWRVKYLDLAMKHMGAVPQKVFELSNLEFLDLSFNNISYLPLQISKLLNLEYLNLGGNNLKSIPDYLYKLANLKQIVLKENQLPPSEIQKLKKLLPDCAVIF